MQLLCKENRKENASKFYVDDKTLNSAHKSAVTFSFSSLIFQQYKIGFKQELT